MNINEIKDEILKYAKVVGTDTTLLIKIPFYLIQDAIYSVKDKSNMDIGTLDYSTIYFYQITEGCKALLSHLELELDYETDENGNAVNALDVFEMYREIYEYVDDLDVCVFAVYEAILSEEKMLAKEEYIGLGQFEARIIGIAEKLTESVNKISEVATDKKKLKPLLAEFTKAFKGLDINGLKELKESKEVKEK